MLSMCIHIARFLLFKGTEEMLISEVLVKEIVWNFDVGSDFHRGNIQDLVIFLDK